MTIEIIYITYGTTFLKLTQNQIIEDILIYYMVFFIHLPELSVKNE